ncbi:hypothetical protein BJ138DRAFT_1099939 [Hygrophoropsis aurantiaca]|uniref:Uncharacterized protein n=1 Tax=Hygrophoropsis aurantiaca TaxID=72124 RepID=A0ACB8AHA7_9AGAM|nr:hypothetical protein BJ138DRAFT_1099939 [Hygrophoropsis aurantiaca]
MFSKSSITFLAVMAAIGANAAQCPVLVAVKKSRSTMNQTALQPPWLANTTETNASWPTELLSSRCTLRVDYEKPIYRPRERIIWKNAQTEPKRALGDTCDQLACYAFMGGDALMWKMLRHSSGAITCSDESITGNEDPIFELVKEENAKKISAQWSY